jgi:branched-chain amino acid transport system substrate-binding protein
MERCKIKAPLLVTFLVIGTVVTASASFAGEEVVKIGFNHPETGPYAAQGTDQLRGALMTMEEINAQGGILEKKIELGISAHLMNRGRQ